MVEPVEVQKIVFETFGDRPLWFEKKIIDNGMTVKCRLYIFGNDAGTYIVFKKALDDRAVGGYNQKVALSGDVSDTTGFPGQIPLLKLKTMFMAPVEILSFSKPTL